MNTDKKEEQKKKIRRKEQAIDKRETEGQKINPQEKQKREKHQPRDTA